MQIIEAGLNASEACHRLALSEGSINKVAKVGSSFNDTTI
jgi:hypothetical protein